MTSLSSRGPTGDEKEQSAQSNLHRSGKGLRHPAGISRWMRFRDTAKHQTPVADCKTTVNLRRCDRIFEVGDVNAAGTHGNDWHDSMELTRGSHGARYTLLGSEKPKESHLYIRCQSALAVTYRSRYGSATTHVPFDTFLELVARRQNLEIWDSSAGWQAKKSFVMVEHCSLYSGQSPISSVAEA